MIRANFLVGENGTLPSFGHEDTSNAGIDLYSAEDKVISCGNLPTEIDLDIKLYFQFDTTPYKSLDQKNMVEVLSMLCKTYMKIESRSGLAFNNYIELGAGIIDESFRGSLKVICYNNGSTDYYVKKEDRIAQGIIYILPNVKICRVQTIPDSKRGEKGFGASGK